MQSKRLRSLLLLFLFCAIPSGALAFQEAKTQSQDSAAVQKREPISVVRVVTEMEELQTLIDLNKGKINPGARLKRIDSLYPVYKKLIADEESNAQQFIASNPNRQKIEILMRRWDEYRAQLNGWETEIMNYVGRNLRLLESLDAESEVWGLTLEQAKKQEAPAELLNNVQSMMTSLDGLVKQTKDNNYLYLRLQTRINRMVQTVDEVSKALTEKKNSDTYRLLNQRHPPIWAVSFTPGTKEKKDNSETTKITDQGSRISELLVTHREKLYLLAVLGLGLAAFVIYLRRQVAKNIGLEAASQKTSELYLLMRMPVFVVVFLLFFATRFQLLNATRFLGDFLIFALLILAIQLIKHQVSSRFRGLIYFSILFFILDTLKSYVWFYSIHYRIYMFVEAILMVGILVYFIHPFRKTIGMIHSPLGKFIIGLVPVVYTICIVSIIANLLGYTNLADLSLKVCTQSGIVAIIAYALFVVLQSILISWFEQRFRRSAEPNLVQLSYVKNKTIQFLRVSILILFLISFLKIIDELQNVTDFFSSLMTEPFVVGNLKFTLGSIFMFVLILLLSYVVSRLVAFLISDQYGLLHFFKLPKGIPAAISLVLRYSIMVFGVVIALSYLNVDLSEFNLMAGALGLGIGFGLQTVIANFVSGLILVFERPILPGDTIEVNNLMGKVSKIGVRASSISTYDGAEVVVPNMNLVSNDLINWTLSDSIKRVEILVGTTYDADPNQVLAILKECATGFDYVIREREPMALFTAFGESSLDFRLLFWVPFEIGLKAKSDVSVSIYNAFREAGIEIPFPQRDVHIKNLPQGTVLPEDGTA